MFDSGFTDDEDLALVRGQFEDAGDVDRGAVGRTKDFFDVAGDSEVVKFLLVVCSGFCAVVCDEDDLFALASEEFEGLDCSWEEVVAGPENAFLLSACITPSMSCHC